MTSANFLRLPFVHALVITRRNHPASSVHLWYMVRYSVGLFLAAHEAPVIQINPVVHFLLCHLHRFLCVLTTWHRHLGAVIDRVKQT